MDGRVLTALQILLLFAVQGNHAQNPASACSPADIEYKYTECDSSGRRWRVSVPKSGKTCHIENPAPPMPGPPCDKACKAGEYLDVDGDQKCKSCPAGTFSVGDGVRYDQWDSLPPIFTQEDPKDDMQFGIHKANCSSTSSTWITGGDHLEAKPGTCMSDLTFQIELINEGQLKIEYQNTYSLLMAIVQVKSLCQTTKVGSRSESSGFDFLKPTKGDDVANVEMKMVRGTNKVTISLLGRSSNVPNAQLVIKSIEISGMAFTDECTKCKPGYYSSDGSSQCTHCLQDTYAPQPGASGCLTCEASEFAPPGSSSCKLRPPCTSNDYYKSIAPCENNTTHETYDWLTPRYCNDKADTSVQLPAQGETKQCPPCDAGQSLNSEGTCQYCPSGMHSDGVKPCTQCPLHTEARKSLSFTHFDVLPPRLSTGCIKTSGEGSFCDRQNTWVPRSSFIQVSDGVNPEDFAVLNINITSFSNDSIDGRVFGRLQLKFDITCDKSDPCLMYLMQEDTDVKAVQVWNETSHNTLYTHNFTNANIRVLSLAFRKSISASSSHTSTNTVKIYQISVSNTMVGGATLCTECMLGGSANGCHSCGAGEIIVTDNSTQTKSCVKCADNHIVVDAFTCAPCGYGLVNSADYSECVSDCTYQANDLNFDFTAISGTQSLDGVPMFTADGTSYHNAFNYVLCTRSSRAKPALATCVNNASESYYWDEDQSVSSAVCRETILPSDTAVSIQPTSLGDSIVNITANDQLERNHLINVGKVVLADDELTIHYRYSSNTATANCQHGLTTTITLICDSRATINGTKSFPPACVTGTCDGCHYQLVWRTRAACPKCADSDYELIIGECVGGEQSMHYLPRQYCPMTEELKNRGSTRPCSLLTLPIRIGILASSLVGITLIICVIVCWKRSRKLEYKYMRLVEGAQGKEGELPAAQTCAWSDGEDEEADDRVAFKTKGDQLFGKLGNKCKGDGFEKMKLVGSSLPEI